MRKLIVANYKMNGDKKLFKQIVKKINKIKLRDTKVVLCPPFIYLNEFKIKNNIVSIGSQDITNDENSKSTGQISAKMLLEHDVKYVIVGHSERRKIGENDKLINQKINVCLNNFLMPIICVGEEKKTDKLDIVLSQIKNALDSINKNFVPIIAYEPVWSIGTGKLPSINRIDKMIDMIKSFLKTIGYNESLVLYGGSVGLDNYKEIIKSKIDGLLLGGVSLRIDEFIKILKGIDNE